MSSTDSVAAQVACPTCDSEFDTETGMKVHHAQAHNRSLNHGFRDVMGYFKDNHDGQRVLLSLYHDETMTSRTLYGTLYADDLSLTLDTGDRQWQVLWLGGKDPAGYYVYPPDPDGSLTNDSEHIGRVVGLQLVDSVRVEATDDGLETMFEGCTDLTEAVDNAEEETTR